MAGDLEKASPVNGAESSSTTSSITSSPVLEPIRAVESRRSRRRDPDFFEPLEHALTPDLETEAEREAREPITYTQTGTSVTSNASRPADFEVFFQDGDPENPGTGQRRIATGSLSVSHTPRGWWFCTAHATQHQSLAWRKNSMLRLQ
ncbi:hypothetical protein NXS19_010233 [Fusarium pseudograminearum]|nr:hypothetical protein NXS19_010233 [Fusarium pseudograminearum]